VRGNGIGLSVCDEIITRLGGRLEIGNAEGGGCLVTLYLPMTTPAVETPSLRQSVQAAASQNNLFNMGG
jgi:K+-sensing histidine kinase KdpD